MNAVMSAWLIISILLGIWATLSVVAVERERRVRALEEAEAAGEEQSRAA